MITSIVDRPGNRSWNDGSFAAGHLWKPTAADAERDRLAPLLIQQAGGDEPADEDPFVGTPVPIVALTPGSVEIGGRDIVVMAGPCAVESKEQLLEVAHAVKEAGATILRGGAFKPRTSPYSFQGLGEKGLQILAQAREETGLMIVTETIDPENVACNCSDACPEQCGQQHRAIRACLAPVCPSCF